MGDRAMALGEAELLRIGDYVKGNLKSWLQEVAPPVFMPDPVTNTQLLERIVRLEERFERVDDRFLDMDRRFDAVDRRFEAADNRFDELIHHMDKRLGMVQWLVIAGLAAAAIGASLLATYLQ
jgi:hypothetical protein